MADAAKFASDRLKFNNDFRSIIAQARDLKKRYDKDFGDLVYALPMVNTPWEGTPFTKDEALDGAVFVEQLILWLTNQNSAVRDYEGTVARLYDVEV